MTTFHADRVQETTASVGTGLVTLAGAVTGFRAFSNAFSNGDVVRYSIAAGTEWEVGEGTYGASTITRNGRVFASSNAGALVNFSSGTKAVWCDVPAASIIDPGQVNALINRLAPQ